VLLVNSRPGKEIVVGGGNGKALYSRRLLSGEERNRTEHKIRPRVRKKTATKIFRSLRGEKMPPHQANRMEGEEKHLPKELTHESKNLEKVGKGGGKGAAMPTLSKKGIYLGKAGKGDRGESGTTSFWEGEICDTEKEVVAKRRPLRETIPPSSWKKRKSHRLGRKCHKEELRQEENIYIALSLGIVSSARIN